MTNGSLTEASATSEIVSALLNVEYNRIGGLVEKALQGGVPPQEVLTAMQDGMRAVGEKYEAGEYFLSELMGASEMMKDGLERLTPHLSADRIGAAGTVVIGTVRGDIRDVGKNLVKTLLQTSGFTVHDLGLDVEPEAFVDKVKETKADVLAMSALLTTTMPEMRIVIEELEKSGARGRVKVIVGGNAVTEEFGREIRADGATKDAVAGVKMCQEWVKR